MSDPPVLFVQTDQRQWSPGVNASAATVRVNQKAADRVGSGHLWIFSSDVLDSGGAEAGSVVRVLDRRKRALGMAHYSSDSQITLRLLSRTVQPVDAAFFVRRIEAAAAYRQRVVSDTEAYRVVHGEGDLLPGLIVDRYGQAFVVQLLTQGMDRATSSIVAALRHVFSDLQRLVARNDASVRAKEHLPLETKLLAGAGDDPVEVQMNGLRWQADLSHGQKTGLFLDQRENYLAARRYARGRALDCFTATGGFALHLAPRCQHVEAVDSSPAALELGRRNATANALENIAFRKAEVLDYLPAQSAARRQFDMVVLDPPAFTKTRSAVEGAARGYKELNLRALRLLPSGGVLVSCSCSYHMSEAHLLEIIAAAALESGRQLRVIERRTQARDHGILLTVPETHYLKCLIFAVL